MNLFEVLFSDVAKLTGKIIIKDGPQELTGKEFLTRTFLMAKYLKRNELQNSKHIAIVMPNCPGYAVSFLSAVFAGKVAIPLNPLLTPIEITRSLKDTDTDTVISLSHFKKKMEEVREKSSGSVRIIYLDEIASSLESSASKPVSIKGMLAFLEDLKKVPEKTPVCILQTSGTQGKNKGVILTHKNLASNIISLKKTLQIYPEDKFLSLLPWFHTFGLTITMLLPISTLSSVVILRSFNPAEIIKTIEEEKITALVGVPSLFRLLLKYCLSRKVNLKSIRLCISGGAHLPIDVEEKLIEVLGGKKLIPGYGLTETAPVVSVNPAGSSKRGCVGPPIEGVEVGILDDNGKWLPPNKQGEIAVRGNNVMVGYYNDPEATTNAINPEGWLLTGDFGMLDDDGFLFVTGRKKEIIICGGENIYPQEIEEALFEHPLVEDVAVVGKTDETRGEYPAAFIKVVDGESLDERQLRKMLKNNLASFKLPREFVFVDELPRNALGKILKHKL